MPIASRTGSQVKTALGGPFGQRRIEEVMVDLNELVVSLTKHGAHKIVRLIEHYEVNEVLAHCFDTTLDIDIDEAQARKTLGVSREGRIPTAWNSIKQKNRSHIRLYVFFAIVFSHKDLIRAMKFSRNRFCRGVIVRDEILEGKPFTNFKNILEELGFSVDRSEVMLEYDVSGIFDADFDVGLLRDLVFEKFRNIGMQRSEFQATILDNEINGVFGLTKNEFNSWFLDSQIISTLDDGDSSWDSNLGGDIATRFVFVPGHLERSTASVPVSPGARTGQMNQHHSRIQNELYRYLARQYRPDDVGTEVSVHCGNRIDVVLRTEDSFVFFEIKTAEIDRIAIREALPQLLEYSYWPNEERSRKLCIVAPADLTDEGVQYLLKLSTAFALPVSYWYYDPATHQFFPRF